MTTLVNCLSHDKNHLTIIWQPLRVSLSTLKIYLTSIWPPMQLVSLMGRPSDYYPTTSPSESLYTKTISDHYLTTNVTSLFPLNTIWPLSEHHSVCVSFPGKSSDKHLTATLTCSLIRNHLTIIGPPLRQLSLFTLEIYLTNIWRLMQLVSFLGKQSDHYLTYTLYEYLTLENHLTCIWPLW